MCKENLKYHTHLTGYFLSLLNNGFPNIPHAFDRELLGMAHMVDLDPNGFAQILLSWSSQLIPEDIDVGPADSRNGKTSQESSNSI